MTEAVVRPRARNACSVAALVSVLFLFVTYAAAQADAPWRKAKCEIERIHDEESPRIYGADPQSQLIKSIRFCSYQSAIDPIHSGMELNFKDSTGHTPLTMAIEFGQNSIVQDLLRYGADPNWRDPGRPNSTVLMGAAFGGKTDAVRLLLLFGARPNEKDGYGETALMYAADGTHIEIVRLLLAYGADLALRDKFGKTAKDRVHTGHPEIIALLESDPDRQ